METWNAAYLDEQYRLWKTHPEAVSPDFDHFFRGFELGTDGTFSPSGSEPEALAQARVEALVYRYRDMGHLLSCLDPLVSCPTEHPLLSLSAFGLTPEDFPKTFHTDLFEGRSQATLKEIIGALRETYCRSIGVEYMHLQDPEERAWLQNRMEPVRNRPALPREAKTQILSSLCRSTAFEAFLNKKYPGQTRFSLEGADVLIPMLGTLVDRGTEGGVQEIILGMPHRGRLNVQTIILGKSYEEVFCEFESTYDPDSIPGAGDVKYHKGYLADIPAPDGKTVRVALMSNPSHLESVNPVVEGFAHARHKMLDDTEHAKVMPLLIHGEAAFAGQGIVAEVLNMSQLAGYHTGGTVHLVVNNQIGYTTLPEDARSTRYATDLAKMLMVPIFHVHGEDPEAADHVVRLACDYRMHFHKDVVIDLVCFRRFGHNEGDEPYFTQPLMYDRIKTRPTLYALYRARLAEDGTLTEEGAVAMEQEARAALETAHGKAREQACVLAEDHFFDNWSRFSGVYDPAPVETGVPMELLQGLGKKLNSIPENFALHPTLVRLKARRAEMLETGAGIDWAFGEALAFATLLAEGTPVRLSGQDSRRGTFSQRHSILMDQVTGESFEPLSHLGETQAPFTCCNSLLSEAGVVGFEYGYSLARPEALTLWEAQFGDFANGAQTIIDLYLAAGQSKWRRLSGLTLLLPHGYEGLGPEHSSARIERFLQLCAEENLQVCNPSTPAQYFHLLRRQAKVPFRKPLILFTPKGLLRHPEVISTFEALAEGIFQPLLMDPAPPESPDTVLLCSGKIFYELLARRRQLSASRTAIVRIEQLYPLPLKELAALPEIYASAETWAWVQEEPENMGAWRFMRPHLEELLGSEIQYIGRKEAASPAPGIPGIYRNQQATVIDAALGKA